MAKNVRWKYEPYAFYNKAGIEERLSEMTAQGWFIEKIGFFWKYRKGEPATRTYNVVYMEDPDSEVKEQKQLEFVEYCEAAGWNLIYVMKNMLVFCHDGEKPVPIETDVEMELDSIDKVMRSDYLQTYISWAIWCMCFGGRLTMDYKETPFTVMTDPLALITLSIILAMLFWGIDGLFYLSWMKKAKRHALEYDVMLPTPARPIYKSLVDWIKVALILSIISTLFVDFDLIMFGTALVFGGIVAIISLANRKKREERKSFLKGTVCKKDHKAEAVLALAAIVILWCCFAFAGNDMSNEKDLQKSPVSLRDLIKITPDDEEFVDYYMNESLFAKYIYFDHDLIDNDEKLELHYVYGQVKLDSLYEKGKKGFFFEEEIFIPSYKVLDADTYGAKEAYYRPAGTEEYSREKYVFVWEDAFAKVEFDHNLPTHEQVKIVAEKLGNIE